MNDLIKMTEYQANKETTGKQYLKHSQKIGRSLKDFKDKKKYKFHEKIRIKFQQFQTIQQKFVLKRSLKLDE